MSVLVVDASVVIKWIIDEPGTGNALALLRHRLLALDLLIIVCANILWKKVRRKELSEQETRLAARLLARVDIELLPARGLLEAAVRLALEIDHPAYDCIYLALALARNCGFVTADERLCRKAWSEGYVAGVVALKSAADGDLDSGMTWH